MLWLFDRDRHPIIDSLKAKFSGSPEIAEANVAALNAGHAYGETAELPAGIHVYKIPKQRFHLAPIGILLNNCVGLGIDRRI